MKSFMKETMEDCLGLNGFDAVQKFMYLSEGYSDYWAIIDKIYAFMKAIGFALIITFFLKSLLQEATKDNLTIEQLIKSMIGLIFSVTVISNIPAIANAFMSISDTIAAFILADQTTADLSSMKNGKMQTLISQATEDWAASTGVFKGTAMALIFMILHQIAIIGLDFAIITRALDLGWKVVIAPIACADMFDGMNSPGIRHLKSLFGSALVVALIAILTSVGSYLICGFMTADGDGKLWMAMATQLALAGAAIGANNKAKEILG